MFVKEYDTLSILTLRMYTPGAAKSELTVITEAKDICRYIFVITEKSPKRFRFTLVSRLQNLVLGILKNMVQMDGY